MSIGSLPSSVLPGVLPPSTPMVLFSSFATITTHDHSKLVSTINSYTCILDAFPTTILKGCLSTIGPLILNIFNTSLITGIVPCELKVAAITPFPKKPGCDSSDLTNYRPISNPPFLAKVLECVVLAQLHSQLFWEITNQT